MSYPVLTGAAIQFAFPDAEPMRQYSVSRTGGVVSIDRWNAAAIGSPKPTPAEVQAILDSPPFRAAAPDGDLSGWLDRRRTAKLVDEIDAERARRRGR